VDGSKMLQGWSDSQADESHECARS